MFLLYLSYRKGLHMRVCSAQTQNTPRTEWWERKGSSRFGGVALYKAKGNMANIL